MSNEMFVTLFNLMILIASNLAENNYMGEQNHSTAIVIGHGPYKIISGFFQKLCDVPHSKSVQIYFRPSICLLYYSAQIGGGWTPSHTLTTPTGSISTSRTVQTREPRPRVTNTPARTTTPLEPSEEEHTSSGETLKEECHQIILNCSSRSREDSQVCSTLFYCPILLSDFRDSSSCDCNPVALFTCNCTVQSFDLVFTDGTSSNINTLELEIYGAEPSVKQLICNLEINPYGNPKLTTVCGRVLAFE